MIGTFQMTIMFRSSSLHSLTTWATSAELLDDVLADDVFTRFDSDRQQRKKKSPQGVAELMICRGRAEEDEMNPPDGSESACLDEVQSTLRFSILPPCGLITVEHAFVNSR